MPPDITVRIASSILHPGSLVCDSLTNTSFSVISYQFSVVGSIHFLIPLCDLRSLVAMSGTTTIMSTSDSGLEIFDQNGSLEYLVFG